MHVPLAYIQKPRSKDMGTPPGSGIYHTGIWTHWVRLHGGDVAGAVSCLDELLGRYYDGAPGGSM